MSGGRLAGMGAIVTGVAGGIGAAIAERFRAEGATVVGLDRTSPAGATGECLRCDVTDSAAVDSAVAAAVQRCGGVDVLVTAAALTGGRGRFPDVTDAEWHAYIEANLSGTFFACRAVARSMIAAGRGGSIITLGSINALAAEDSAAAYATSKGGVAQLTKAMAVDLARYRIRANMLAPGPVEVARNSALFHTAAVVHGFASSIPMGAAAQPGDVANAAVFLAEPAAAMITGTTLLVDGGMLARIPTFTPDD